LFATSPALIYTFLRRRSMKLVKNVVFAVVLVSTLAVYTPAGDINTPGAFDKCPITGLPADCPAKPAHSTYVSAPAEDTTQSTNGTIVGTGEPEALTTDFLLYEALSALLSIF
jgi:hypothetical protein